MTQLGSKGSFPPSLEGIAFAGGKVNARGQILTWGPFDVMGFIDTVGPEFNGTPGSGSNKLEYKDQQGDSFMDVIDGKYRCVYHTSGIVYIEKPADGNLLTGWSDPVMPAIHPPPPPPPPPQSFSRARLWVPRAGLGRDNVDTPSLIRLQGGTWMICYSSSPGVLHKYAPPHASGHAYCIQFASCTGDPNIPNNWRQTYDQVWTPILEPHPLATWERPFQDVSVWDGGVYEQSVLWEPNWGMSGAYIMFYAGYTFDPVLGKSNPYAHRLGRAVSTDGVKWVRDPSPTAFSYVWSPDEEEFHEWGGSRAPHHFAVTRATDGVYHLAMLGLKGEDPKTQGIGHWYSTEQGAKGSWKPDPNNPLITWKTMSWAPIGKADKLGSPNFFWDGNAQNIYLAFDGGPDKRYNVGARIWVAKPQWPFTHGWV